MLKGNGIQQSFENLTQIFPLGNSIQFARWNDHNQKLNWESEDRLHVDELVLYVRRDKERSLKWRLRNPLLIPAHEKDRQSRFASLKLKPRQKPEPVIEAANEAVIPPVKEIGLTEKSKIPQESPVIEVSDKAIPEVIDKNPLETQEIQPPAIKTEENLQSRESSNGHAVPQAEKEKVKTENKILEPQTKEKETQAEDVSDKKELLQQEEKSVEEAKTVKEAEVASEDIRSEKEEKTDNKIQSKTSEKSEKKLPEKEVKPTVEKVSQTETETISKKADPVVKKDNDDAGDSDKPPVTKRTPPPLIKKSREKPARFQSRKSKNISSNRKKIIRRKGIGQNRSKKPKDTQIPVKKQQIPLKTPEKPTINKNGKQEVDKEAKAPINKLDNDNQAEKITSEVETKPDSKTEVKAEPIKEESKPKDIQPKVDSKPDSKTEVKVEPLKEESKSKDIQPKVDSKSDNKTEVKAEPIKEESKPKDIQPKVDPKPDSKTEVKAEPIIEESKPKDIQPKVDPKPDNKTEVKAEPIIEESKPKDIQPKVESKPDTKIEVKAEPLKEESKLKDIQPKVESKSDNKTEVKAEPIKEESKPKDIQPKVVNKPETKTKSKNENRLQSEKKLASQNTTTKDRNVKEKKAEDEYSTKPKPVKQRPTNRDRNTNRKSNRQRPNKNKRRPVKPNSNTGGSILKKVPGKKPWIQIATIAGGIGAIILTLAFIFPDFSFKSLFTGVNNSEACPFPQKDANYHVLVLPFHNSTDCLNLEEKYTDAFLNHLNFLNSNKRVMVTSRYVEVLECSALEEKARRIANSCNADLVVWGRL